MRAPRAGRPLPAGRLLVAVGLLAAGGGAFVIGSSLEGDGARLVAGNSPVNAGAGDARDLRANNSPSLARNPVDPRNIVVANRIDTPLFSCALHVSTDDGTRWRPSDIPFPEGEEAPPRCFAPDVAFGADGTLYTSFVTLKGLGNEPNAVWLVSSSDGGRTFSPPRRVLGPLAFQVRLSADPHRAERLYLSWLQASETASLAFPDAGNPIRVARSDDGGTTWQPPVRVSPASRQRSIAPSPGIGPRGEVYVSYLDLREDSLDYNGAHEGNGGDPYPGHWSLVVARSSDLGATWQETVVDDAVVPIERFIVFFPPAPSLAIDQVTGRVYVAFHDGRGGNPDVLLWASRDRGITFAPPIKVNDTAGRDPSTQSLPKLAVAPGGRLDVVYYDRRADPDDVMNEVSLQSSNDDARSFGPRLKLTDTSFDSRVGFGSERGMPDLGSRLGLLSSQSRALAVWTDTRAGTQASNKQDLARAIVAFSDASPMRDPLRYGGILVGALGLLVAASCLVVRARRHGP